MRRQMVCEETEVRASSAQFRDSGPEAAVSPFAEMKL